MVLSILGRSAWRSHVAGLWPRVVFHLLVAVLVLAGVRTILRGDPPAARLSTAGRSHDLGAEAFAESFVRTYLTWNAGDAEGHARDLAPYLPASLSNAQGIVSPGRRSERVHATAIVADQATAPSKRTLVVAAETTHGPVYVAVAVGRTARGFLFLATYPALVGPPASTNQESPPSEQDVSEPALETVLRRAIGNYVESQASNLRADLTADAVVSLPPARLVLRSVDRLSWARSGIAAAELTATGDDGSAWTLRYELAVVKRDRWYVKSIAVNPALGENNQ